MSIGDKEIGELWRAANKALDNEGICTLWAKAVINLIRKLVEERAKQKYADHGKNLPWDNVAASYRWNACRDCGIDPQSYHLENIINETK